MQLVWHSLHRDRNEMETKSLFHEREKKLNVIKNLTVLVITYHVINLAVAPTNQLQSSLYIVNGMGTTSNSVAHAVAIVACVLVPPITAQTIGLKKCILLGFVLTAMNIAINFYPTYATLIIFKFINSALHSSANSSALTLVAVLAERYRKISGTKILAIVFAAQSVISNVAGAIGEAITYVILNASVLSANHSIVEDYDFRNKCGSFFVSREHENSVHFRSPDTEFVYTLFGVFLGLVVLNFLLCAFFLDPTPLTITQQRKTYRERFLLVFEALRLNRDWRAQCLLLCNIHVGLLDTFRGSDVNKAFVTCLLGMQYVGIGAVLSSVFSVSFSVTCSFLVKYTSRIPFFVFSVACELALLLLAICWTPVLTNDYLTVYSITALFGWVSPGFAIVFHVLHAELFPQQQQASYASFLMAINVGSMIGNAYSETMWIPYEVYILLCMMTLSTICYLFIEYSIKKNDTNRTNETSITALKYQNTSE